MITSPIEMLELTNVGHGTAYLQYNLSYAMDKNYNVITFISKNLLFYEGLQ